MRSALSFIVVVSIVLQFSIEAAAQPVAEGTTSLSDKEEWSKKLILLKDFLGDVRALGEARPTKHYRLAKKAREVANQAEELVKRSGMRLFDHSERFDRVEHFCTAALVASPIEAYRQEDQLNLCEIRFRIQLDLCEVLPLPPGPLTTADDYRTWVTTNQSKTMYLMWRGDPCHQLELEECVKRSLGAPHPENGGPSIPKATFLAKLEEVLTAESYPEGALDRILGYAEALKSPAPPGQGTSVFQDHQREETPSAADQKSAFNEQVNPGGASINARVGR